MAVGHCVTSRIGTFQQQGLVGSHILQIIKAMLVIRGHVERLIPLPRTRGLNKCSLGQGEPLLLPYGFWDIGDPSCGGFAICAAVFFSFRFSLSKRRWSWSNLPKRPTGTLRCHEGGAGFKARGLLT